MKKQSLLTAVAMTTVAIAGAAQAQQYTLAPGNVGTATVKAAVSVASEVKLDPAVNAKGSVGLVLTPSVGAILPTGNSKLTFALTGGHTFGSAVTPGAIVANAGCAPTTVISSGGAATGNEVTFLISNLGGCNNGVPIHVQLPVQLANTTTALGINSTFTTELGTSIDGGAKNITNTVQFKKAFDVKTTADAVTTAATLASGFKVLTGDVALGTVVVTADTTLATGIQAAAPLVAGTDVTKADFKFVGLQDSKAATLKLDAAAVPTTGLISVNNPVGAAGAVTAVAASVNPISASTYTAETTLTLAAGYTAQPAFGPSSLQSITREGSTVLLPWVASQTLVGTSQNETIVRIANIGNAATGAVSAELLTSSAGVPASTALVPLASSIAKGGELVITSGTLQTAFGADFGRGDVRITVEALPAGLIVRRFVRNVVNNALTEVSLGRDVGGNEPQN